VLTRISMHSANAFEGLVISWPGPCGGRIGGKQVLFRTRSGPASIVLYMERGALGHTRP
jgi:hypothetical protein